VRRCRSLESPACIVQLRRGIVAPPPSSVAAASIDGAPPTTRAAATRSLDAAPPPCSAARSRDGAPPSACAARLRGPDAAPPAARHGEGEPSEPSRGRGEPRGGGEPSGVNGGRGTVRGCRCYLYIHDGPTHLDILLSARLQEVCSGGLVHPLVPHRRTRRARPCLKVKACAPSRTPNY
jgi:hypothetical protein